MIGLCKYQILKDELIPDRLVTRTKKEEIKSASRESILSLSRYLGIYKTLVSRLILNTENKRNRRR